MLNSRQKQKRPEQQWTMRKKSSFREMHSLKHYGTLTTMLCYRKRKNEKTARIEKLN